MNPLEKNKSRFVTASAALLLTLTYGPATAQQWELGTTIDLSVIHTDNLTLAPEETAEDEIIYAIVPTFTLTRDSERLEADIRYRPEAFFFDDQSDFNEVFHVVDANLTATLLRNSLYFFAGAYNYQSIQTPDRNIPTTNVPITANRVDSRILEARPYWDQDLGFANVLLELAYIDTTFNEFDNSLVGFARDNTETRATFELQNRSNQQRFAWGLNYQNRSLDYEDSITWEYQRAALDLGIWVNQSFRAFVVGGQETGFEGFLDGDLDEDFWEVGFQYRPSQRLNLELAAGERSYGDSYRAELSYQLRRGSTALTYSEQPRTLGDLLFDNRPIADTDNLDDFLNRPGEADGFILKRGEWRTTLDLARTDVTLRLFYEIRDQRSTALGDALQDEELSGAAFRLSWRMGGRSTLGLSADFTTRETEAADADLVRYAVDYALRLSRRLSVVLLAQRVEEDGTFGFGSPYEEQQFRLTLRSEF